MTTIDLAVQAAAAAGIAEAQQAPTPAPAPAAAPDQPAAPAPPPAAPAADDTADLIKQLETRKAERLARRPSTDTSALDAKIANLEATIARLEQHPSHPNFAQLVREHGEVEALRMVGIDPLEYFNRFKEVAKDPSVVRRKAQEKAEAERIAALEKKYEDLGKSQKERDEADREASLRAQWNEYTRMVEKPESGTPLLAKLDPAERVRRTQDKIQWLHANDYDVSQIDDRSLAKLVEADMRRLRDLLAGTEASATMQHAPATDGVTTTTPTSATTLSNDLASQSTGRTKPLSEKERFAAAVSIMNKMQS